MDFEDDFFSGEAVRKTTMKLASAEDFEGQQKNDEFQIQMTFEADPQLPE